MSIATKICETKAMSTEFGVSMSVGKRKVNVDVVGKVNVNCNENKQSECQCQRNMECQCRWKNEVRLIMSLTLGVSMWTDFRESGAMSAGCGVSMSLKKQTSIVDVSDKVNANVTDKTEN